MKRSSAPTRPAASKYRRGQGTPSRSGAIVDFRHAIQRRVSSTQFEILRLDNVTFRAARQRLRRLATLTTFTLWPFWPPNFAATHSMEGSFRDSALTGRQMEKQDTGYCSRADTVSKTPGRDARQVSDRIPDIDQNGSMIKQVVLATSISFD